MSTRRPSETRSPTLQRWAQRTLATVTRLSLRKARLRMTTEGSARLTGVSGFVTGAGVAIGPTGGDTATERGRLGPRRRCARRRRQRLEERILVARGAPLDGVDVPAREPRAQRTVAQSEVPRPGSVDEVLAARPGQPRAGDQGVRDDLVAPTAAPAGSDRAHVLAGAQLPCTPGGASDVSRPCQTGLPSVVGPVGVVRSDSKTVPGAVSPGLAVRSPAPIARQASGRTHPPCGIGCEGLRDPLDGEVRVAGLRIEAPAAERGLRGSGSDQEKRSGQQRGAKTHGREPTAPPPVRDLILAVGVLDPVRACFEAARRTRCAGSAGTCRPGAP